MTLSIKGIAASRGIAIGHAYKLERGRPEVAEACIHKNDINNEILRLKLALEKEKKQLRNIRNKIPAATPSNIAEFIDTHLLMLNDSALSEAPIRIIKENCCTAEWALKLQLDALVSIFDEMDDQYLKTRRDDVIHVVSRILRLLTGEEASVYDDTGILNNKIIIADDLTPADIVLMQHHGVIGFITESGGPLSHAAIISRSLKLPAIVGVHQAKKYLINNDHIIIDGESGTVLIAPDINTEIFYRHEQKRLQQYYASLSSLKKEPAVSLDNINIHLFANAELTEDMNSVNENNVDGIGLYRTEFLFMNRENTPDEEEQYQALLNIITAMNGKPVTIRTLDLGADKPLKSIQYGENPANPALGLRAIRLCLSTPDLFRPQLRAILRASAKGNVRIMIPMLSNIQEVSQVFEIIKDIKQELSQEGLDYDDRIPVGGMIEVPAAAISAYLFAKHLDFLSIGTNDLIQYTLAIDRIDEEVNYLYSPCHPSVLRLIHQVIKAGNRAGIPVAMCGEMAGDPIYTRLLLGLGLREFSMQINTVQEVKNIVNNSLVHRLVRPARSILMCDHAEDALEKIKNLNNQIHLQ
ncbi:MAG TPA: phosphoenolpyruvate--protein phosphotransferase [Gammaproteobacteria bacterium]|mgnify:CR=1 FL=1|nr:phosphoenolpyruvate--protein phosphotransferase [Gammaproteobacteria bacterium]